MPTNTLTDQQCRTAKPGPKPRKLFDGHGLHLVVTPAGAKLWRMAYRLHGKPQTATFGAYPLVSLADARGQRDKLRKTLQEGANPKLATKRGMAFSAAAEAYWAGRKDVSEGYRGNALRGLQMHLAKSWAKPIAGIGRADLLAELMVMDAAALFVYVRRVRMWAGQVFEWAIEQGHCSENPAASIDPEKAFGRAKVKSHAALGLAEVPGLLQRLALERELQSVLACRLMALTWVRTQELRMMRWGEIEGDLWRIPEERMKHMEHLVPLSRQALQILAKMKARSRGSDYVFPSDRRLDRPMSENSVLYLLHRLGYKGEMTGHGWRSVASTWANEGGGFNPDAIERQLAHVPDDKVRAVYNRAAYLVERRTMLQAWADWLDQAVAAVKTVHP